MIPTPAGTQDSPLNIVPIGDYAQFLKLREQWNMLAADRSVFLRHEWFDAAWQWRKLDESARLAILCAYRGTRLVGILPLIGRTHRSAGAAHRMLEFLTVPDNQLCDIIIEAAELEAVADAFSEELVRSRRKWDVMRLSYLPDHSPARSALARALDKRGIKYRLSEAGGNPYISLETSWEEYYATRSRSLKKANNLAANRLKKAGEVRIDWLEPESARPSATAVALDTAIAISASSWKRSTGNSLDNPGPQAFIRRLSELALEQGWLSLWLLALDGRPMAMEYQLVFHGNVHALRADFIEGCDEISPGSHLNRHQMEQLFGRGLKRYLMGPGDNPYKKRWTEVSEPLFQLVAYSPSVRGKLAALWDTRLRPALSRLKTKIKQEKKADAE